jgi:hypothetical protein
MKRAWYVTASLAVLLAVAILPQLGVAKDNLESGVIEAYDGRSVRVFGEEFLISTKARQQLEAVLKLYPSNGLKGITIRFVPKKKGGENYIDSVEVPINDA